MWRATFLFALANSYTHHKTGVGTNGRVDQYMAPPKYQEHQASLLDTIESADEYRVSEDSKVKLADAAGASLSRNGLSRKTESKKSTDQDHTSVQTLAKATAVFAPEPSPPNDAAAAAGTENQPAAAPPATGEAATAGGGGEAVSQSDLQKQVNLAKATAAVAAANGQSRTDELVIGKKVIDAVEQAVVADENADKKKAAANELMEKEGLNKLGNTASTSFLFATVLVVAQRL